MSIVYWSHLAKIDYWNNIEYLEKEWTDKEVIKFIEKVDEIIDLKKFHKALNIFNGI